MEHTNDIHFRFAVVGLKKTISIVKAKFRFYFTKTTPAIEINPVSRGTLQTSIKRKPRTHRLKTIICGSHKMMSHVCMSQNERTTSGALGSGMANTSTNRPCSHFQSKKIYDENNNFFGVWLLFVVFEYCSIVCI